ncbi:hypothetical protein, partial [Xanthomonas citri]|uniref:hypothetical protein n=1 Tax=Xanthomonas citri TaxID=346 RepID=UPI001CBCD4B1
NPRKKAASQSEAVKDCVLSGRKTPLQGSHPGLFSAEGKGIRTRTSSLRLMKASRPPSRMLAT